MVWLNFHHLLYFQTVANEGSIIQASKKLRLGQPTISTQLKLLEEALQVKLFDRRNKKLILTEEGKVVLEYANQIFALGDELKEVIYDQSFSKRSHLQVGVMESLPKRLIYKLVQSAQTGGQCTITVLEGTGDFLLRELSAHRLDLVFTNFPPHIGEGDEFFPKRLASVPISIFGTSRFRHLKSGFPKSLQGQPFILPTLHSKLRHDLDHYFRINNIPINITIETQDTSVQKILGIEGLGLVPLPDFAGQELVKEKKLIKIGTLPEIKEDFWIIAGIRKITNPLAEQMMENFQLQF
jgi:LysR family transcriptional activator of nhaA